MPPTYNGAGITRRANLKRDGPSLDSAHAAEDELGEPAGAFGIELARLAGGLEDEPQVLVGGVVAQPRSRARARPTRRPPPARRRTAAPAPGPARSRARRSRPPWPRPGGRCFPPRHP